ncbi:MAG: YicC family protein [Saprospiraceae bacterium]|nr:YicC family protein [Saprospiraceae bacterium]MBK8485460.1 YicC family protein [Saprospiraceae bacterium]MBK9222687.1 YicC family protein [Saprospiraceae bacterium]MBK9720268.1 YicC family protein [Saprospiraceae bacterium]
MLLSMTGFGNSKGHFQGKEIVIEIRCVNSKVNDFRLKIPNSYRQHELDLRKILNDKVIRGKMDLNISVDSKGGDEEFSINKNLFLTFYNQIKSLSDQIDLSHSDILNAIMKFPNVIVSQDTLISNEEYHFTLDLLNEAIEKLNDFRSIEGNIIANDMELRTRGILDHLQKVEKEDPDRTKLLKEKLLKALNANFEGENIDRNRFEQELLYYLERLDITEEKVRLKQHCEYFLDELNTKGTIKSRKLNFISQEIGREINTLGSKAQYSPIQKLVVNMKDDLEKIKEQMANVL